MSLSKKALLIGIGSTIAVGGLSTAIAVPLSQQTVAEQQKPEVKPSMITTATRLDDLVKALKPSDIIVLNKKSVSEGVMRKNDNSVETTAVNKSQTYAFNLTGSQFDLTDEAKKRFPSQVSFKFELEQTNNTSSKLNDGSVITTIKAMIGNEEVGATKVELTEFKKANTNVVKLFTKQDNKLVLDLTKVVDPSYKTIETLNELKEVANAPKPLSRASDPSAVVAEQNEAKKQSGITELLQKLMVKNEGTDEASSSELDIKKWSVEGTVKLDRISPDEGKTNTNFYLTNADNSSILKLVSEDKQEVSVDQLVVTNLLATSINVVANNVNEEGNKAYLTEFVKDATTNGYKANEYKVSLDLMKDGATTSVSINPYLIEKRAKNDEIKANLVVSFGTGNNAKSYNLGLENDEKELKEAGFSFGVYLKKTDKKDKLLKATDLTGTSKLEDYFVTKNFSEGFDSMTTLKMDSSFTKVGLESISSLKDFLLGKAEKTEMVPVKPAQADMMEEVPISENWVSFVTYTYKQTGLENKVLLTPVIDVIHLEVKEAKLPAEAAPTRSEAQSNPRGANA